VKIASPLRQPILEFYNLGSLCSMLAVVEIGIAWLCKSSELYSSASIYCLHYYWQHLDSYCSYLRNYGVRLWLVAVWLILSLKDEAMVQRLLE
jgi:hypothetical protein